MRCWRARRPSSRRIGTACRQRRLRARHTEPRPPCRTPILEDHTVGIVVQKYGGSSLADADAIKRVARRIVEVKKSGHDVVVAVSAMGDTTDDLDDLANGRLAAAAGPRDGHAAHRGRADLDGARRDGDQRPRLHRPLVHRLPGRRDHRLGARQGQDHRRHARPDHPGHRRRPHRHRRRLPGRLRRHQGDHHPRPRRQRHHRRRARRRARGGRLRDLHRRRRRLHRRPARSSRSARKLDRVSYEEMLELAACGSKILHLRCVEYGRRYGIPIHVRSSFSQLEGTWVVNDPRVRRNRGRAPWNSPSSPESPTTSARPRSPSSACPTRSARPPASSRRWPTRRSTST